MRISELHRVERPRERLQALGAQALRDEELLAIVLRTGYAGRSALEVAQDVLGLHPDGALASLAFGELRRLKGVGLSRAAALAAALELARRWSAGAKDGAIHMEDPERVWGHLHDLRGKRQEHFVALYLNARNHLLHRETVSVGTLTASLVHPREVFAPAVERRAAAVIVAHNHPSGDCRPSPEDLEVTRRLARAGAVLGIELLDHVLVADGGYFSFRREGRL